MCFLFGEWKALTDSLVGLCTICIKSNAKVKSFKNQVLRSQTGLVKLACISEFILLGKVYGQTTAAGIQMVKCLLPRIILDSRWNKATEDDYIRDPIIQVCILSYTCTRYLTSTFPKFCLFYFSTWITSPYVPLKISPCSQELERSYHFKSWFP